MININHIILFIGASYRLARDAVNSRFRFPEEFSMSFRMACALFALFTLLACAATASAQSYPSKPIRFIIPFPPGGPTDLMGRTAADRLARAWNVQVVADNRAGAGGNIGTELCAKSPPEMTGSRGSVAFFAKRAWMSCRKSSMSSAVRCRSWVRGRTPSACSPAALTPANWWIPMPIAIASVLD